MANELISLGIILLGLASGWVVLIAGDNQPNEIIPAPVTAIFLTIAVVALGHIVWLTSF